MHLLRTRPGGYVGEDGIANLEQTPADLVILSAADTEIALLAACNAEQPADYPSVRLANLLHLRQPASIDLYVDEVLSHAKVVVASLLGGVSYWRYLVDRLMALAAGGVVVILVPGDDSPDPELAHLSTAPPGACERCWRYLREGGPANGQALFAFLGATCFGRSEAWQEPLPLPKVMIYHPDAPSAGLDHWRARWRSGAPVAPLLFYRAHLQSGNTAVFNAMAEALLEAGVNPLPIAVSSLKLPLCLEVVERLAIEHDAAVILNTTGFSMSATEHLLERPFSVDVPVLQVVLSGGNERDWRTSSVGLSPRDLAMNVVLPELDGRIVSRAVSFKELLHRCERTQVDVVAYRAVVERMGFVARLARNWTQLGRRASADKRVALVLANYPTREGRIGNGVGLDTPASVVEILRALAGAGYGVSNIPPDGNTLIEELLGGVTNAVDTAGLRACSQALPLADYRNWFGSLPEVSRRAVVDRWGAPEGDPMVRDGGLMVAGVRLGNVFVGIQPARGYHLDLSATYHDPDLVPPHGYLAFYCWLRESFHADAIVHVGKHGNLEWLPGKGVALAESCWPDLIFGPTPHVYPFIVNDPGEGTQAKRRTQAVIIDHLVPPLTRAETYGPLRDLERLVDEYYEAMAIDPRRAKVLREDILRQTALCRLNGELGLGENLASTEEENELLTRMDAYLCELKESQIRDGLHVFGRSPEGDQRVDTLLALSRLPVGDAGGANDSLIRALARDFDFDPEFDPLDCNPAESWYGPNPAPLLNVVSTPWRNLGDTRERLELYARKLIQEIEEKTGFPRTDAVLQRVRSRVAAAMDRCGAAEIENLLAALSGRFVPAGPSGAPSRGRLDVLPTGRNFYSVDVRAIPTPTAWQLGFKAAQLLVERHVQDHGEFPRTLGVSVWGTSTMRTGGDDIAQALALLGVRPVWATGSNRVEDFEILPADLLNRPRIDVTLRISGFFRDAFSNVVRLFDSAVQAVADLDEQADLNPIRARVLEEALRLERGGLPAPEARQRAGWRVFGSKPGAYGAGLQGLMDEQCWDSPADLAHAYVNWGGYAYGARDVGTEAHEVFRLRLSQLEVVLQNQDNREHDILDSDDYYQFQGGMAVSVATIRGKKAVVYHGDHSNPHAPRLRTLEQEIARVIRSRVVNPKWIAGVKRHGYKGAFEMAATVDYLFAYDATTGVVDDYQYAMVCEAYLEDAENREFLRRNNPNALRDMAERLLEATQRGLWKDPGHHRDILEDVVLAADETLETM